ncbi:MAG TPA: hypothetical protein VF519_14775 [Mycobacteriales bacterium]|jgi:hypothetical protein
MTESTFPFAAAGDEPETAGGDRKKLALVGVAGALVVALLGYFVVLPMLAGSDPVAEATIVRGKAPVTAKKPAAAKPAVKKPAAQPATYADTAARQDPFKPLVVEPVVAPPVAGDPAAVPAGGTTGGTTTGGTTGGTTTGGTSANVGGQRVALVLVYAKDGKSYAQTKVGDTVFTPAVGEVFSGTYKLLAVSGKTATYLFGDEQFTLSEGQEVLK